MIGSPGLLQTRESLALSRGDWRDDMAVDLIWARLYILLDQTRYQCSVLSDSKALFYSLGRHLFVNGLLTVNTNALEMQRSGAVTVPHCMGAIIVSIYVVACVGCSGWRKLSVVCGSARRRMTS